MDDPREFGHQLADRTVACMESEGLSSDEAAIFAAEQIVKRADEMVAAGESREAAATWTQFVTLACGTRLDERIKGSEELTELAARQPTRTADQRISPHSLMSSMLARGRG